MALTTESCLVLGNPMDHGVAVVKVGECFVILSFRCVFPLLAYTLIAIVFVGVHMYLCKMIFFI